MKLDNDVLVVGKRQDSKAKAGQSEGLVTSLLQCVARTGFVPVGYNGGGERANLS